MQSLFQKNVNSKKHQDKIKVPIRMCVTYGDKSVRNLGFHIQNMLQAELKRETSYGKVKCKHITNWSGRKCNCISYNYIAN